MYNNTNERGLRHNNHHTGAAAAAGANPNAPLSYGQSAASGPAPTTAGPHRHDALNKLDPRVDSTRDHAPMATQNNVPKGTYGPHSSRLANALDPRVDSDLDNTRATGAGAGMGYGAGGGMTGGGYGAAAAPAGAGAGMRGSAAGGRGVPEGSYGPHSSRLANALDPRVDSDRDRHVGPGATHAPGAVMGGGRGGVGAAPAAGVGGMSAGGMAAGAHHGAATGGPHSSNLMNKLDPRVDSTTGTWKAGAGTGAGGAAGPRGAY